METELTFQYLKKKVMSKGLNCSGYKDDFLRRRFEGRMHLKGVSSFTEYAHYVDKNPNEFKDLWDALTINVSEFFRDPSLWKAIQTRFLPSLIKEKLQSGKRQIRAWCAGCADGEEPYTLAISLIESLSYYFKAFEIEIVATDIDAESLNRAQRGIYHPARLKPIAQSILQKYFSPTEEGTFRLSDQVKKLVTLRSHDLFTLPPASALDMICCRNVIIYFSRELQQMLFRNFYNALAPQGYLVLGKVESPVGDHSAMFECVDLAERIYRKI
jgi:chemotaxis protein methyltransferase CheR